MASLSIRTRSEILARLTTCLLILVTVQPIWANPPATLPDGERKGNCSYVLEVETTCAPFAETSDNISVRFGDSAGNHVIHKKLKYSKPVFKPLSEQKLMGLTEKKPFDRCSFDKFKVEGPCMQADVCYLYFKRVGTDQWRPGYAKIQAIVSEDGEVELMSPASEYTFYFRNFLPSHVWFGYNYCDNAEKHHLASLQEKKHNFIAHKKP